MQDMDVEHRAILRNAVISGMWLGGMSVEPQKTLTSQSPEEQTPTRTPWDAPGRLDVARLRYRRIE
jgi:hypothetical protein